MVPVSKKSLWVGRTLSALVILFLAFGGAFTLTKSPQVTQGVARLGYPDVAIPIGLVLLACTLLYAVPRTSVLGAILLTGYLGGATASHVRLGEAFWFPVVVGVLVWAGLFLRDPQLRTLIPLRTQPARRPEP